MTKDDLAKLLLECEVEFMWCESHWGSDYTEIRARLKAAAAEIAASDEPGAPHEWETIDGKPLHCATCRCHDL